MSESSENLEGPDPSRLPDQVQRQGSGYVRLMEARKMALWRKDKAAADEIMREIRALVATGVVTSDEFTAGAYI